MSDGVLVPAPVDLVNGRGGEEKHGETEYHPRLASPIHHERHLRVACIGAGASGLLLAYKVQRSFDNFTLTLYEKNPDIAGTWYENKYPGCACDVPSHNYTWSFEPKTDFTSVYPSRKEIFRYFNDFSLKHGLRKYCKFRHRITGAKWDDEKGEWNLDVEDSEAGKLLHHSCDILINAGGVLNEWKWPDIPGLKDFKGTLLHSADWDDSVDLKDKHVGVIGNGASGIQIIPAIQPIVKKLTTFIRNPTWVSPAQGLEQHVYSPEERANFEKTPGALLEYRKMIERSLNGAFATFLHQTDLNKAVETHMTNQMKEKLHNPSLADNLIPKWAVGCRRLTPGPGYLEALTQPNVSVIFSSISHITPTTLHCTNSTTHTPDILICATGFNTSFVPRFPITNHAGTNLQTLWSTYPQSYLGVAAASFPNYLTFLGPNSPIGNGPVLYSVEAQADYMLHWLDRYQTENIHRFSPRPAAVDAFTAHKDAFMKKAVWAQNCKSWYKRNSVDGPVTALWPGSALHYVEALGDAQRRGEDWEVVFKGNRFAWLGDGFSRTERDESADWGWYIGEEDGSEYASRGKRRKVRTGSGLFVNGGLGKEGKAGTA